MSRTDKIIIAIALLLITFAVMSIAGFDQFMSFSSREQGEQEAIAEIVRGEGDFRVKYRDQFHWERGRTNQKLVYDDSVFTGEGGSVDLMLGQSQVELKSNTLVVIRQNDAFKTLNLSYGGLAGEIAKDERFYIETADGQRFEITAVEKTALSIESDSRGEAKVLVKSGNAKVVKDGQAQNLKSQDNVVFKSSKPKSDALYFTKPSRDRQYAVSETTEVAFEWNYNSGRPFKSSDQLTLELSADPDMASTFAKENLGMQNQWTTRLKVPGEVYYRVKDANGNLSEIRRLAFIKPEVPQIVRPEDKTEIGVIGGTAASIDISLSGLEPDGRAWLQVARDPDFKDVVTNKTAFGTLFNEPLSIGDYYIRVKGVYDKVQTAWSPVHLVIVNERIDEKGLATIDLASKIVVPNVNYPRRLYGENEGAIQSFLGSQEPFTSYFSRAGINGHELMIGRPGRPDKQMSTGGFPANWIRPGLVDVNYHYEARGRIRSEPRLHRLTIEMEPPNELNHQNGIIAWSPILFARGYEAIIANAKGQTRRYLTTNNRQKVALRAGARYEFKVRALGQRGMPISDWSEMHSFDTSVPEPVVREQASVQPEVKTPEPAPIKEESTIKKTLTEFKEIVKRTGGWFWAGTGANYYSVRQTINNTADVDYKNIKGPSFFMESGYLGNRAGVAASYKRTPGDVRLENKTVTPSEFVWDTFTIEGLYQMPKLYRIFGEKVRVGARAGLQYHQYPFLYVQSGQLVAQARINMLMASVGAFADTQRKRFNYHTYMRYQQPMKTSAEGGSAFSVAPTLAFDGLVGASYRLDKQWRTGLFWYGQLHDYKFSYRAPSLLNQGKQSLFYSNMEFRLGVDF